MQADVRLLTDRRGKRPLDRDLKVADRLYRLVGKLGSVLVQTLEAGVQRAPGDSALARVSFVHGCVDHVTHYRRDV